MRTLLLTLIAVMVMGCSAADLRAIVAKGGLRAGPVPDALAPLFALG